MNSKEAGNDTQRNQTNSAEQPDVEQSELEPREPSRGQAERRNSESPLETAGDSADQQLAAVAKERDSNYERWMRAEAELKNYRKRVQKENEEYRLYAALPLVRDLLPALDNLRRAVDAAKATHNVEELTQGVEMVAKQIEDALAGHSAVAIEAVGQPFDPNLHEAIQQLPSPDHPPMTVIDEVERGYKLGTRVVRPSKVIVSARPPDDDGDEAEP